MKKQFALCHRERAITLNALHELVERKGFPLEFIIGVSVGFVNVEAAKELFLGSDAPYIINEGRKGGSNVAAICNAILLSFQ